MVPKRKNTYRTKRRLKPGRATGLVLLVVSQLLVPVRAAELLFNGDFEIGAFGWTTLGLNGGIAVPVVEGTCFSAGDTTGITLPGNKSMMLRSNGNTQGASEGFLSSGRFIAGDGVSFLALSETRNLVAVPNPVNLQVHIVDPSGNILLSQPIRTGLINPAIGCPSEPRNAVFYAAFIDTRQFTGQEILIQFQQTTRERGYGYFTLIDNVKRLAKGELSLHAELPIAIAGTSVIDGVLNLDGSRSFDSAGQALIYTWYIDDEANPRFGETVAIDDLAGGNHTAVLYVNDGANAVADTLLFVVPGDGADDPGDGNGDGDGDEDGDGDGNGDGDGTEGDGSG